MHEPEAFDRVNGERSLGHDLWVWRRDLPGSCSVGIAEGFAEARTRNVARRHPDRFVRKWLQLRIGAVQRQRVVTDEVTPDLIRRIDVVRCPITRVRLTHGELLDSDWSIDRLNNDGAYAANNLAVMGTGANRAKGSRSYEEVFALSGRQEPTAGLMPNEWLRMASVMLGPCFAVRPSDAPLIPLVAPLPNLSLRQTVQQVQYVFTHAARKQSGKNGLIKSFSKASSEERSVAKLRMAAEAMHQGLKGPAEPYDAWLAPHVLTRFTQWWDTLGDSARAVAGEISRRLLNSSKVPSERLDTWNLSSHGYLP